MLAGLSIITPLRFLCWWSSSPGAALLLVSQILILSAHLLCMNVASGAPLIGIWLEWRARRGDSLSDGIARYLAAAALVSLIAGSGLGLALGWLFWTPDYTQLWQG